MIRLSRKSEYALLAIGYLHDKPDDAVASVKDIAAHYDIPTSLLAKVMQTLKRTTLVSSVKGMAGGYTLSQSLSEITFLEFLRFFEDDTSLVECLSIERSSCQQADTCTIRDPIAAVNAVIQRQLQSLTLAELFDMQPPHSYRVPVQRLAAQN